MTDQMIEPTWMSVSFADSSSSPDVVQKTSEVAGALSVKTPVRAIVAFADR
jgi:hypothetical protein